MHIILKLINYILSRIAVKISFLWGRIHTASFATINTSRYLPNDMQNWTSVTLYTNIIIMYCTMTFGNMFEMLHCYGAFARRQQLFKQESTFKQRHVDVLPRKYYVISQLRHINVKDPLWTLRVFTNTGDEFRRTHFAWRVSYDDDIYFRVFNKSKDRRIIKHPV